ncbi:MAG TPA: adenine phosphoribosyltransferase [Steroidobacteraceae bacterium]|nr:adenine phosphoribosyltransferase [Steroidobacteraceae bacterium]
MLELLDFLPSVADFPRPGIIFRDVCPLLADPRAFAQALDSMEELIAGWQVDRLAGIEARGLIFAAALSVRLDRGLILLRKPGKLPPPVTAENYSLEYGQNQLEIQSNRLQPGSAVIIVDDVIATGGTLLAAKRLIERQGGRVSGILALLSLQALGGRERLQAAGANVASVLDA